MNILVSTVIAILWMSFNGKLTTGTDQLHILLVRQQKLFVYPGQNLRITPTFAKAILGASGDPSNLCDDFPLERETSKLHVASHPL